MKKTLNVLGVMLLAVLAGSFLIMSCGSPTNGDPGGPGQTGATAGLINEDDVSAALLESLFYAADIVTLGPDVDTVEGVVPAKGKLIVAKNSSVAVLNGSSLEVNGALEIREDAGLDASYVNTVAGYLKGTGSVTGAGSVSLPYLGEDGELPEGGISYASYNVTTSVKTPGSYRNTEGNTGAGAALNSAGIAAIFAIPGINTLTVKDITGLTAAAVPVGKTLTLTGDSNTVVANLDLGTEKGTLIVEESAVLTPTSGITITGSTEGNITIDGTIEFPVGLTALTIAGGVDLSSAAIDASSLSGDATLTLPSGAAEIGEIAGPSGQDLIIAGATSLTVGEISGFGSGKGVKSETVKKYIAGTNAGNYVELATAADELIITGFNPTTNVFSAANFTAATLLTIGGNAKLAVDALGATEAVFPLTTANLGKIAGTSAITYSDAVTGTAETLTIPEDITVTASSGTLKTITGLVLNGVLTLTDHADTLKVVESIVLGENASLDVGDNATLEAVESIVLGEGASLDGGDAVTLEAVTSIAIGENATLTVGDAATFAGITEASAVTGAGSLVGGAIGAGKAALLINSPLKEVTLDSTGITGDITIAEGKTRTLTAAAVPVGDVTVIGTLRAYPQIGKSR